MTASIINIHPLGFPWKTQDPFLFCAHHRDLYPAGDQYLGIPEVQKAGRTIGHDFVIKDGFRMYHGSHVPGFPYHPHRGFETITINKEGIVDHSDSLGGAGRFGAGDVQWMTAGKGILHSEMFPMLKNDQENTLEIFQIWLNLPKVSKMVPPHFKMLWSEEVPVIHHKDQNGFATEVDLIAGTLNGHHSLKPTPDSWAANPENEVLVATIKMEAGATYILPKAQGSEVKRNLYFYRGTQLEIAGKPVSEHHSIEVLALHDLKIQNTGREAFLLILQGRPIHEPVVQHGPFVMNTEMEIREAFTDYQQTQFGGWPWPQQEQVHERNKGRFALHSGGRLETKEGKS
ncbi:pirin family protein [Nonlabens sp.]|uniref:pirin family protein n=1 Tax=Nonlabens sp. TaxID=1888209 RepID=UPI0025E51D69|nr:pirin family protein [Nonlabens sp.]